MSGSYDDFGFEEQDDGNEPDMSDPGVVAFLDQEEAEFDQKKEQFTKFYGFEHDCRCSQDYTEGNLAKVTNCYLTLTSQALARCAQATHENRVLAAMLDEMLKMNNDLVGMLEQHGHIEDLEAYFGEIVDIDEDTQIELQFDDDVIEGEDWDEEQDAQETEDGPEAA